MNRNNPMPPALARYVQVRGANDLISAVKADCQRLVANQNEPPIHLESTFILSQQRIRGVRRLKIPVDGRVFWEDGGYVVELNASAYPARQNFTLAHEIGHTLFLPFEEEIKNHQQIVQRQGFSDPYEEWICNVAAGELLMPEKLLRPRVRMWGLSIAALQKIAYEFGVSIAVSANRMVELSPWPVCITGWRSDGNSEFSVDWSYCHKNAGVFLLRGATARDPSLLNRVCDNSRCIADYTDLGFMESLRSPVQKRFYTEAFAYKFGRTRQIVTVTIFARSPEAIASLYDDIRRAEDFEKMYSSRQLNFSWFKEVRQLDFPLLIPGNINPTIKEKCVYSEMASAISSDAETLAFPDMFQSPQLEMNF